MFRLKTVFGKSGNCLLNLRIDQRATGTYLLTLTCLRRCQVCDEQQKPVIVPAHDSVIWIDVVVIYWPYMSSAMSGLWWTAKTCHRACTWQRYLNRCGCDLLTLSCLRPCQVWWIGQTCHRACTWQRYRNKCCFNLLTMSGLWWTARTCHRACTWQRYRNEFTRNHFIPSFCSINRRI